METILIIIAVLLGIICLIAFGILSSTLASQKAISDLSSQLWSLRDNQIELSQKQFEEVQNLSEELKLAAQESSSSLADIQFIMNIIYKYKLPDKEERALLDRIKIDNQSSTFGG